MMRAKAKIDGGGMLWVKRAGSMKEQVCPRAQNGASCGDWCPKFVEGPRYDDGTGPMMVEVCGHPVYEIIADERPKENVHATLPF